ncbi:Restriction endonuclease subunit R [Candidatus Electrothrix aarhusensis]
MAFTDFNSPDEVQKAYNIISSEEEFLHPVPRTPSESFLQDLEFSRTNFDIFSSEASRCEAVIFPLLREACKAFVTNYSLWSHKSLAATTDPKLTGTPDYIIARRSELGKNVLGFPLVLIAEAKQNNFTKGWGQCLAELVAAQALNDHPEQPIYGIVTDAEVWQFGKLTEKKFTRNLSRALIDDIEEVFGAVYRLLELATEQGTSYS